MCSIYYLSSNIHFANLILSTYIPIYLSIYLYIYIYINQSINQSNNYLIPVSCPIYLFLVVSIEFIHTGHQSSVESMRFDTEEEHLATGSKGGSIKLFDLASGGKTTRT